MAAHLRADVGGVNVQAGFYVGEGCTVCTNRVLMWNEQYLRVDMGNCGA